jgi:hypothetical protein
MKRVFELMVVDSKEGAYNVCIYDLRAMMVAATFEVAEKTLIDDINEFNNPNGDESKLINFETFDSLYLYFVDSLKEAFIKYESNDRPN